MNNALTDVRKAYRLLFQYQRKIIDSIQLLTTEYKLHSVGPKFSGKPKLRSFNFKNWSWDYLPFYQPVFKFYLENGGDKFKDLCIYITSDNGHFLNETEESNDRTNLERFVLAEESQSCVVLMISAQNDVFNYHQRISVNNNMAKGIYKEKVIENKVIAKCYPLEVFKNEDTIKALRLNFKNFVISNDINANVF